MALNFTNVIKPTHICNIGCVYCYNEDTRAPVMSASTLASTIEQTFSYAEAQRPLPKVDFIWHGGEPMVAGLPFYEAAVALQRGKQRTVGFDNTIQTNGLLITDRWAEFFKQHKFRVSVSIDGPKYLTDRTRIDLRGQSVFDRILKGISVLRDFKIPFGVCVVITRQNADDIDDVYDFLVQNKLPFNVIPLTRSGDAAANFHDIGLGPEDYAKPWIRLFDRWWNATDEEYVYCSDFALKTRAILGGAPTDCIGQANCSTQHVSTDPDGFVYPCATLSGNPEWAYGNITENSLEDLMRSGVAQAATARVVDPHCVECKWRHVCHGGCMQRAFKFYGTHNTRDYYCDSLYQMYEHVEKRLRADDAVDVSRLPSPAKVDVRVQPPRREIRARKVQARI